VPFVDYRPADRHPSPPIPVVFSVKKASNTGSPADPCPIPGAASRLEQTLGRPSSLTLTENHALGLCVHRVALNSIPVCNKFRIHCCIANAVAYTGRPRPSSLVATPMPSIQRRPGRLASHRFVDRPQWFLWRRSSFASSDTLLMLSPARWASSDDPFNRCSGFIKIGGSLPSPRYRRPPFVTKRRQSGLIHFVCQSTGSAPSWSCEPFWPFACAAWKFLLPSVFGAAISLTKILIRFPKLRVRS